MNPAFLWKWPVLDDEGACAVCNKVTKERCTACKTVYYCNTDHQKLHWNSEHRENCGVIELAKDPIIGRHYIAKRKIERGEIVFPKETPLVTFLSPDRAEDLICLKCFADLNGKLRKICNKCKWWPLCLDCTEHGAECEFTIKYGKIKDLADKSDSVCGQNSMIGVIRVLALREENPELYSKILTYEDQGSSARTRPDYVVDTDVAKRIKKYFNVNDVEESELAKIYRILRINSYKNGSAAVFFEKISFLEHSCLPNCSGFFSECGGCSFFAVKTIAPGEHISICYWDVIGGTMDRRAIISKTYFFDCTCPRCEDPTEFGTMFNAIKCVQTECEGNMLPPSFAVSGEKYPDFICLECKCARPWKFVENLQENIKRRLCAIDNVDVNAYKYFVKDHENILHKNHYLMVEAKIKLAEVLGFNTHSEPASNVTMTDLDAKIQLSEEISKLLERLTPGDTTARGKLMYGSSIALFEKYKRNVNPVERDGLLMIIRETLTEVCKVLCYESESLTDVGNLARNAMDLMKKLT